MDMHSTAPCEVYRPHNRKSATGRADRADAITTQIVRNALNSAANQMKRVLIRTSFSPIIYEAMDFAVALYDREVRMLAQAPTVPAFMGTMSFCVEAAVEAAGGESGMEPGDIVLFNLPYGTGSHAQDMAVVMPIFRDTTLVGYAVSKGHLTDIGAKAPYCTDSIDLFQEGVIFPGVKLYRRGELVKDIFKMMLSNSRAPNAVKGDILAEVACVRAGADELLRVIDRFGVQVFQDCCERMYEYGEAVVRDFISRIPEGRYKGSGHLDNDGLSDEQIHFDVEVVVEGGELTFDLSRVPDAVKGPLNNPFPSTVSACRITLAMLAGNESPNEGHFRPMTVISRPGSMFHPTSPQPTFMYGWALMQLMEALFEAFAAAMPGKVPSGSAADVCGVMFWRFDEELRELQVAACPQPVGLGALPNADGSTLLVVPLAQSTLPSAELQETKWPFLQFEKWEFADDSAGPGQFRGGMGWHLHYRLLQDVSMLTVIERTKVRSWGQAGGGTGQTNSVILNYPDGRVVSTTKVTGLELPRGTLVEVLCGGGGGYGDPLKRDPNAVHRDVRLGYVSGEKARDSYPQAFA